MGKEASPDRSCRTSGGGPAGGFRPRRRFGSCSKGCAARRASPRCAARKGWRRICTTGGVRVLGHLLTFNAVHRSL